MRFKCRFWEGGGRGRGTSSKGRGWRMHSRPCALLCHAAGASSHSLTPDRESDQLCKKSSGRPAEIASEGYLTCFCLGLR